MTPKEKARLGEFWLEEAILDVLAEARTNNELIGTTEIARRSGTFREDGHARPSKDWKIELKTDIVWAILNKLAKQKRAFRTSREKATYEITNQEYKARKD